MCITDDEEFNGTEYWMNNIFCFDVLLENGAVESIAGMKSSMQKPMTSTNWVHTPYLDAV